MACDLAKLQAAKDAYHNLMTGKQARVVVDQNGERVEFVATNAYRLAAYIKQLENECSGNGSPYRTTGPIGFIF